MSQGRKLRKRTINKIGHNQRNMEDMQNILEAINLLREGAERDRQERQEYERARREREDQELARKGNERAEERRIILAQLAEMVTQRQRAEEQRELDRVERQEERRIRMLELEQQQRAMAEDREQRRAEAERGLAELRIMARDIQATVTRGIGEVAAQTEGSTVIPTIQECQSNSQNQVIRESEDMSRQTGGRSGRTLPCFHVENISNLNRNLLTNSLNNNLQNNNLNSNHNEVVNESPGNNIQISEVHKKRSTEGEERDY